MLARHMLGYMPSLIVPGLLSFASVFCFTRLLSPESYGHYVLAINVMTMLLGVGFFWLQSAASRLLPGVVERGDQEKFTATLYGVYALCAVGLLGVAAVVIVAFPLGDWRVAAWFAPPLAILRAGLNLNQAYHRNFVRIARYNIIEIGQSVIGLSAAILLIMFLQQGASGAALGTLIGLGVLALYDCRFLFRINWRAFDRDMFREIVHFGLPFIVNYGLSFILSRSDSFLIQHYYGAADVGIYNAGYAFPDRIGQYLFMAVATASLPLTVRRLEQEGPQAARDQTYINGVAALALALPACVGLLFANRQIVEILIGENFREGALRVMPWISLAMILNGLAAHYFDHAFHLAKKTRLFFYTLGPAALFNFIANLWAIPRFGYIGAAYTTVASYALYLVLSIAVGRRVFAIRFPFNPALRIAACTGLMALGLALIDFPLTVWGLIALIATGGAIYGAALIAFDVMGMRRFFPWRRKAVADATGLHFAILNEESQIDALASEWQALYAKAGRGIFGGYAWYRLWWDHLGRDSGAATHVAVARKADGALVALLPLSVARIYGLRLAEWAGYQVFDYGDAIAGDAAVVQALWDYVANCGRYDVASLKDVHEMAWSLPALASRMQPRGSRHNYFLTLDAASGEAWLAAQSRKLRGDTRRKAEKMQMRGPVAFHTYRGDGPVPLDVIDALHAQKAAWFAARKAHGIFENPRILDFLRALAQTAARQGTLYLGWITCGQAIVACHMGFVRDGVLHLYHTTYDAAYGAYSPGNLLMVETIKWATDAQLRELDFMRGDESYKARFASGTRLLMSYIGARSWIGKMVVALRPRPVCAVTAETEEGEEKS